MIHSENKTTVETSPALPGRRAAAAGTGLAVFVSVWLLVYIAGWAAQEKSAAKSDAGQAGSTQKQADSKPPAKSNSKPPAKSNSKPPAKSNSQPATKSEKPAPKPASKPETKQPELPLELRPYRVRLLVAFSSDVLLTPTFRRHVLDRIEQVAARTFGQMWNLDIQENRRLLPAGVVGLKRLSVDDLLKRFNEAEIDKVYFLAVEATAARYILTGREWDTRLRELGALEIAETYQRREVPEAAVSLVAKLFRPLLTVHDADPEAGTVELRTQAGECPPGDPDSVGLHPGCVIVPVFRYLDRKKIVQRVQFLPLTYLLARSIDGARVSATVVSAFRVPIGARRRRVEQLALGVRPNAQGTRLRLVPRSNPSKPLVAHDVFVHVKTRADDEPQTEPTRFMSDRSGTVRIPVYPQQPVVWIYVHSGASLLARVPFVPGLKPDETIQLPDDSLRLSVEGEVALLQARLIETIAKRSAHMSRARALAKKGDHDQADQEMAALTKLPGIEEFQRQLTAIRVPAAEAAQKQRNRSAESKINKLCRRVSEQVEKFLEKDKILALQEELQEIRKLDKEDEKAISEQ